jgi:hypothetical protein
MRRSGGGRVVEITREGVPTPHPRSMSKRNLPSRDTFGSRCPPDSGGRGELACWANEKFPLPEGEGTRIFDIVESFAKSIGGCADSKSSSQLSVLGFSHTFC